MSETKKELMKKGPLKYEIIRTEEGEPIEVVLRQFYVKEKVVILPSEIDGLPVVGMLGVFSYDYTMEILFLPERLKWIGSYSFSKVFALKKVIFPPTLEKIYEKSFVTCTGLKDVFLPQSLLDIEESAFVQCYSLSKVIITSTLKTENSKHYAEKNAIFIDCPSLHHVFSPSEPCFWGKKIETIKKEMFDKVGFYICDEVLLYYQGTNDTVIIPQGVTRIASTAFALHSKMKYVCFPNSVTHIDEYAFFQCRELKNILWSENLQTIGPYAFAHCHALQELKLPPHLSKMDEFAFYSCEMLQKVTIPPSLSKLSQGVFDRCLSLRQLNMDNDQESDVLVEKGCVAYLPELLPVIPKIVATWTEEEQKNYHLKKWEDWDKLSEDDHKVYDEIWKESKWKKLLFNKATPEVMAYFLQKEDALSLPELEKCFPLFIEKKETKITAMLLEYKKKHFSKEVYEAYEENKELIEIGFAFPTFQQMRESWSIEYRNQEDKLEIVARGYLGDNKEEVLHHRLDTGASLVAMARQFEAAKGNGKSFYSPLKRLVIPEGVTKIGDSAFKGEKTLKEILLPVGLEYIGNCAFSESAIEHIKISNGITRLLLETFNQCLSLQTVELPDTLIEIGYSAFYECSRLKQVVFPQGLKRIRHSAFAKCNSLRKVTIPIGVVELDDSQFANCSDLTDVVIPRTLTQISLSAFKGCSRLRFVGYEDGENILPALKKAEE